MSSVNSVKPSSTDLGDMAIKARDGKALMDQMLSLASFGNAPSQNDLAQENKNGIAAIAAAGKAATSNGTSTSSKDNIAQENKNGVAAKAAAGAVASAKSSSESGSTDIDYAAVHMEDLKGKLQDAKNEPPGPARDAKVSQLKKEIAAATSNASSGTVSSGSTSTSTDNSTSSSSSSTGSAKAVKSKLEAEVKKLEEQLASGDTSVQDKLGQLLSNLHHVNQLVKEKNTDIDVSVS
jgi:hypothetical protein